MPGMAGHLTVRSMRWWTAAPPAGGRLGAVLVDDDSGTVRVFIGGAQGHDELGDAELIAQWGAPVDIDLGRAMFPQYADREWKQ